MNLNQTPQPTERVGIGKRISELWNSRNRGVRLVILATAGLVLNCCCVIIPLSAKADSLVAQANSGVSAVSAPALTTTQAPLIPTVAEFDHDSDGSVICRNFSSEAVARESYRLANMHLAGRQKDGRSCQSLP